MGIAVGFGLIVSLLIQIIAGPVVGLFTTDATVILLGAQYIRGYIWIVFLQGYTSVSAVISVLMENQRFRLSTT